MKKQLLTTTALVAAGVLALSGGAIAADMKKPSLKISGGFEQGIGVQSKDGADDKVVQQEDGEIHFTASMKLDNGITVSGKAELESDAENFGGKDDFVKQDSKNSQWIDESYIDITGSFGKIRMGATDGASYEMTYGYMGHVGTAAGHLNLMFDSGLTGGTIFGKGRGLPRLSNDSEALVYFTPRISGMQAGVSYVQSNGSEEDVVSTAVNYNGKFGDAAIGAALGYVQGDGAHDVAVTSAGIKVTVGGFTGAAGFVRHSIDNNMPNEDHTRTDAGLRYKFGPNAVRIGYMAQSDDDTVDTTGTIATFSRALGPGVSWSLDALMTTDKVMDKDNSFFGTSIAIKF